MLFQRLWERGVEWDQVLPSDLYEAWDKWCTYLTALKDVAVPRLIVRDFNKDKTEKALHVFCDASTKAYGAVAYVASKEEEGRKCVTIVMAKSRVAPLKRLTLPRLELMGALIGARLAHYLTKKLKMEGLPVYLWTDSMIVFYWIRSSANRWKQFIANRVSEIQGLTEPINWRHCPGSENPADLLTRGLMPSALVENNTWWNGPIWLQCSESSWPSQVEERPECEEYKAEEKKDTVVQLTIPDEIHLMNLENYSSFNKLVRVTAWIKRFVNNIKQQGQRRGALTSDEIIDAEKYWIAATQMQAFPKEIVHLKDQQQVDKKIKNQVVQPNYGQ
ncbi:uncharacterized protein LOC120844234 [Ixodes scapularis]|uniref:uncharacterized protein LOC120844234 n=1 Tax=Ixodes scapularis TaxID=6945 RepID=UPI001A9EB6DF|nr:uncharacterized protein LOC120844234 [Ixodes scapularis]